MGRPTRPGDHVSWTMYRRAWLVPALAFVLLLVTSFQIDEPGVSALPPTIQNDQAGELLEQGRDFATRFPDRQAGTEGAFDSAQWMHDQFVERGLAARTVPATTTSPTTGRSVSLVNVEATLPGRTRELVVLVAHRDTADAQGRGGDATGQVAMLEVAKELASIHDRRRTYLFASTDGGTLNGGGARALATRLERRGGVIAVVDLDRLDAGGRLRVDAAPSGTNAPPIGLVQAARDAVHAEGGDGAAGSMLGQVARLAAPVTLREHGQLLSRGLPAVTVTAADDQIRETGDGEEVHGTRVEDLGAGLRAVQRLVSTLDQVDRLGSAGRTWVASENRVYRGWALKLLVATLLLPAWLAGADLLVRHRRGWNVIASVGTVARAMLAGIWSVGMLWVLTGVGLFPRTSDRPPNPGAIESVHWIGALVWIVLTVGGWLLSRGPDWRRQAQRRPIGGPDSGDVTLALLTLVGLSALALAINPYAVLFAAPALHAWLLLGSRHASTPPVRLAVWGAGLLGPLLAVLTVGTRSDVGAGSARYALQLVQTRTVPPMLGLIIGAGTAVSVLLLVAALGRVAYPALPAVRRTLLGAVEAIASLSVPSAARRRAARGASHATELGPAPRTAGAGQGRALPRTRARTREISTRTGGDVVVEAAPAARGRRSRLRSTPAASSGASVAPPVGSSEQRATRRARERELLRERERERARSRAARERVRNR